MDFDEFSHGDHITVSLVSWKIRQTLNVLYKSNRIVNGVHTGSFNFLEDIFAKQ